MSLKFEEALENLEKSVAELKRDSVSLDDAIKSYEKGMEYYDICERLLDGAKQKIQILNN